MPFTPVQSEKLSAAVVRQIELLILRGVLRPGERLPAERDLANRMQVSRPSLREAVADLESRGLLIRRAGAGIFVSDSLNSTFPEALTGLFSRHDEAIFDYLAFRRDMEGLAAARAATHGSDTDLQVVQGLMDRMEAAHLKRNPEDESRLDAEFHLSIVEASHNVLMLHMMRAMFQLLRQGVFYNRSVMFRQRTTRTTLLDQHRAINAALQARQPDQARAAVETHLDFVRAALQTDRRLTAQDKVAQQRLLRDAQP